MKFEMAEEALKKLEEQVCCSVCLDTYANPKQLQCHHVFCHRCLVPLVVRDEQGELGISCPTCRQVSPVPDRGVAGLQPAFHISNLLDIQMSFQKVDCALAAFKDEAASCDAVDTRLRFCLEHPEEELKLYCETCGELACLLCAIKGGNHYDHDYTFVKKAFEQHKEQIASSIGPVEGYVVTIKTALKELEAHCEEISDRRTLLEDRIHFTFRQLQESLRVRETELISQLNQMTEDKLEYLAAQRAKVEVTLAQRDQCLHGMRETLRTDDKLSVLKKRTRSLVDRLRNLPNFLQTEAGILNPCTEADIDVSLPEHLTEACLEYGQVFLTAPSAEAREFSPSRDGGSSGYEELKGEKSTAPDVEKSPLRETEVSHGTDSKSGGRGSIQCVGSSAREQHQRCSLGEIPARKFGPPILTINGVVKPWGVAVTQTGGVVVTEAGKHSVSVFCPGGKKILSFGTYGSSPGHFSSPCGVAVDGEGNILVADHVNHRVQKFTAEGRYLASVGSKGSGPLQFSHPSYIAFNGNKLYVVDVGNRRVQILNPDLTYHGSFGEPGSEKGHFGNSARGVACDSSGKVYVVDSSNHRVQVFTAEGEFVRSFGKHGHGNGELDWPNGVAIDTSGVVYVSEGRNNRISVFTSEGRFVTSLGSKGVKRGQFKIPTGLAVDSNNTGVVYVCDYTNSRVQVI